MSVEVLSNVVWINHNGVEIGLPKEVIVMAYQAVKAKDGYGISKEGWDGAIGDADDSGIEPMYILDCPKCGLVPTVTGTCGYCGSKCE